MLAPAIMVQGTASSVGKSLLVTALCRIFRQDGLRVLPFKAQNMALNAAVTADGGEIGRAQAVQAEAAGVPCTVDMNPILLKPEGDANAQVVVLGKPMGTMSALEYHAKKPELRLLIAECLGRLRQQADIVVIEGAGSPAEINLKDRDIVNMSVAKAADAPVLLVGDIDRGGVFASLVGTMELLEPDERARVAAFIINKFRGDVSLLGSGLDFLTRRTGVPVLGVVPYIRALRIADEDSVSLDDRRRRASPSAGVVDIAVVRLPRISNYDDLDPLEHEEGVAVRFVESPEDLEPADLVVLPGSKSTARDLAWLRQTGFAERIERRAARGDYLLGLCGGCQMLGIRIEDPDHVESDATTIAGLALLPLQTRFEHEKVTAQIRARPAATSFLAADIGADISGYEIHMGRTELESSALPSAFEIVSRNGISCRIADGAVGANGTVVGTMIHGIFENAPVRSALLRAIRQKKGLPDSSSARPIPSRDAEYDRLAHGVREHIDVTLLRKIARL